jgi:hypothetical protein
MRLAWLCRAVTGDQAKGQRQQQQRQQQGWELGFGDRGQQQDRGKLQGKLQGKAQGQAQGSAQGKKLRRYTRPGTTVPQNKVRLDHISVVRLNKVKNTSYIFIQYGQNTICTVTVPY